MNVYLWKEKLPSAYQEVEYIQNSGTQYIKTSLDTHTGYRQVMKVRFLNTLPSASYPGLAGGYLGYFGSTYYRLYVNGLNSNGTFNYGFMGSFGDVGSGYTTGRDYTIDFSWISGNMYLKVDGTSLVSSTTTYSTSVAGKACLLGSYSQDFNPQYRANPGMRLYYSKFYNSNGYLIGDFVPCYRKSDNVIGMYDLVNNQFYTNSGSGTFSKGNDVNYVEHELKNNYIGEYTGWKPGANTVAYRPFVSDLKDYSGNNHDFATYTGTTSFVDGMLQTNGKLTTSNLMSSLGNTFTMSMYIVANTGTKAECVFSNTSDRSYITLGFGYGFGNYRLVWDNSGWVGPTYTSSLDGNPHLVTATKNGTDVRLYVDGELKTTDTVTKSIVNATYFMLGNVLSNSLVMKFGRLILENRVRTADEILNYYNRTKSNYGL